MVRLKVKAENEERPADAVPSVNKWQKKDGTLNAKGKALKDDIISILEATGERTGNSDATANELAKELKELNPTAYKDIELGEVQWMCLILEKEDKVSYP